MTPEWHSSSEEAKEVKDMVDEERGCAEATPLPAWEPTPGEAEAQAMQVPSQGHPEETPLRQTAEESLS
jgi:hypothetical protein